MVPDDEILILDRKAELQPVVVLHYVLIRLLPLIILLGSKELKIVRDFPFRGAILRILSQIHGKFAYPTRSRVSTG